MSADITVLETSADRLVDLRHAILRAGLPREEAIFPGDERPDSLHVAAVIGDEVVGCASFHLNTWQEKPAYQLRGMATSATSRRKGVGRAMLIFAEQRLLERAMTNQLWCNARVPAVPFYLSMGWAVVSEEFLIPTAGPHVRMTKTLRVSDGPR